MYVQGMFVDAGQLQQPPRPQMAIDVAGGGVDAVFRGPPNAMPHARGVQVFLIN